VVGPLNAFMFVAPRVIRFAHSSAVQSAEARVAELTAQLQAAQAELMHSKRLAMILLLPCGHCELVAVCLHGRVS